jgi:hypothetical protein
MVVLQNAMSVQLQAEQRREEEKKGMKNNERIEENAERV